MTAKFYLFTDEALLDKDMVPTLAVAAMKGQLRSGQSEEAARPNNQSLKGILK